MNGISATERRLLFQVAEVLLMKRYLVLLALAVTACGAAASSDNGDGTNGGSATLPPPSGTSAGGPTPKKTDLYVSTFGNPKDRAVVLLHGGPGGNAYMFEATLAPDLASKGYFVVTFDQRGCGRSPAGAPSDFTFAKATQDLDDVIHTVGVDAPVLVGHSWGGTLAVKYLELHPGAASGAILVDNPMDYPESLSNVHERCIAFYGKWFMFDSKQEVTDLHARMFPKGLVAPYDFAPADIASTMDHATKCFLYFPSMPTAQAAETYASMIAGPNGALLTSYASAPAAGFGANEHLDALAFTDLFAKFSERVYGIYGAEDGLLSDAGSLRIGSTIGMSHYVSVKGAGHMPFIDQRGVTLDALVHDIESLPKK
jgi:proline iminopeptidase